MICPEASALGMEVGSEKMARPPEVDVFLPGYSLELRWCGRRRRWRDNVREAKHELLVPFQHDKL